MRLEEPSQPPRAPSYNAFACLAPLAVSGFLGVSLYSVAKLGHFVKYQTRAIAAGDVLAQNTSGSLDMLADIVQA